jgi:hypothetical protein
MMARLRRSSVRPLAMAAAGVLLVAIDFRVRAADLVPDPLGWALVAAGAASLSLLAPARWAVAAAVLSLSEFLLAYRSVAVDPGTGIELRSAAEDSAVPRVVLWESVSDVRALVMAAAVAAGGMALVTLATDVSRRAAGSGAVTHARWARLSGAAAAAVWAVPYVVLALVAVGGSERFDPVWNGAREYLAFAGVAVLVVYAAVLVRLRDETWAVPAERLQASRWEGRLTGAPGGPDPSG